LLLIGNFRVGAGQGGGGGGGIGAGFRPGQDFLDCNRGGAGPLAIGQILFQIFNIG
jgi:hypothetical protein